MRVLRPSCVYTSAMGSLFAITVTLSACDSPTVFRESGIPIITKPLAYQAPGEDAVASGPEVDSSNDPLGDGAPDDLTPDDKGEPDTLNRGAQLTRWTFNSSSFGNGALNYASSAKESSQSIVMDNNTVTIDASFTQVDRPMITDLFAQGSDLKSKSESFQQNSSASGSLDILLVVDNSGSMTEEQSNLSGKLSPLLSFVDTSDWRIGVVTTDPKDGCLRSLVSKSDQNSATAFQTAVNAGIKGSGNERGIQQAVAGLKGECNASGSWLRAQSTVAVLIVSDEDNCSDGKGCGTDPWASGNYLTDYLRTIRQPGINARVYGLIGHPSLSSTQCKTMASKANIYAAVIDETGGSWGSICDSDYSTTLQAISKDISVILLTQFTLKNAPTAASLKVYRNNILLSSGYALHGNVVEFEKAPPAGSTIRIDYEFNAAPPQNEFVLREHAEANALTVSLDGIESKAFHLDAAANSIVFDAAPKATSIKALYRRADALSKEFSVGAGLDISKMTVTVNKQALAAADYFYRKNDGMVALKTPPGDKAEIGISFEKILAHRLDYPLFLSADASVSSFDSNSGAVIASQRSENALIFAAADYSPSRKVTVRVKSNESWKIPLAETVLAESLNVKSSGVRCERYQMFGNVLNVSACGWSIGAKVDVGFQYEAEHKELFDLAVLVEAGAKSRWKVLVNGLVLKASDYNIENGQIRIANLPVNAKVEVEMQAQ
ncbi:MAG: VWA domain-containing protein [Oligoflexus sp.]|nr:VWA domain-containing protein [Oligoflexus sp.]